jgi:hypothetical protein
MPRGDFRTTDTCAPQLDPIAVHDECAWRRELGTGVVRIGAGESFWLRTH